MENCKSMVLAALWELFGQRFEKAESLSSDHHVIETRNAEWFGIIFEEAKTLARGGNVGTDLSESFSGVSAIGVSNILSEIRLDPESPQPKPSYFFPQIIGEKIIYPVSDKHDPTDMNVLWSAFEQEFSQIRDNLTIEAFLMLLEKYFSFVPAAGQDETNQDISLYQYAKTVAAFSSVIFNCLFENSGSMTDCRFSEAIPNPKDMRYLLVGGDISGVQNFIYTISSAGALKNLRGRSFYLEMLTEKVIRDLMVDLRISGANLIYSGGGGFCLLAQNTEKSRKAISEIRQNTNLWLWKEFAGKLFFNIEYAEFGRDDLMIREQNNFPFVDVWQKLSDKIEQSKTRKFIDNLVTVFEVSMPSHDDCGVCHADSKPLDTIHGKDIEACPSCRDFFELSGFLRRKEYKFIHIGTDDKCHFRIHDTAYCFSKTKQTGTLNYIINSWDVRDWLGIDEGVQLLSGNHTSGCEELEDLAEKSEGKKFIGALRMDVDNLGKIFIKGLPSKTIIGIAALSRSLTLFFKSHINHICNRESGLPAHRISGEVPSTTRPVDIIYSGGDDLFILGAWNHVAELAFDIHQAFDRYAGNNPDITLSAGVSLHKPKYPVYQIAEMCKKAEDDAKKNTYRNKDRNNEKRKNSLCLFYNEQWKNKNGFLKKIRKKTGGGRENIPGFVIRQSCDWQTAETEIFEMAKELDTINWSEVPHGFFGKLFEVVETWQRHGKFYLPMLHYVVEKSKLLGNQRMSLLSKLNQTQIALLAIPLTWIEYLRREERHDSH